MSQHLRQFLLDLAQPVRAQFQSRLIKFVASRFFRKVGVELAKIRDFLAKAAEVFRDVGHHLHHTLYSPNRSFIRVARLIRGILQSPRS